MTLPTPPDGWQDRVLAAIGTNPDTTSRTMLAKIDRAPSAALEALRRWARVEGGERDAGGGD